MILTELFGFHSKNSITSGQFNQIIKSHVIEFLKHCVQLLPRYSNDDEGEDNWGEDCVESIKVYIKNCFLTLKKSGLSTVSYNKFSEGMYYTFRDEWKYCLVSFSNNWKSSAKKDLEKEIKRLSNPKIALLDGKTLIELYKLPS